MKIATQNINGSECKKNKLIEIFKQNDLDILCLQEIHDINSETINFIEKQTKSFSFIQTNSTKTTMRNFCVVAIFVGKRLHGFKIKEHDINSNSLKYRVMHIFADQHSFVKAIHLNAVVLRFSYCHVVAFLSGKRT